MAEKMSPEQMDAVTGEAFERVMHAAAAEGTLFHGSGTDLTKIVRR